MFGDPDLPTHLGGVSCDGTEAKLIECPSNSNPSCGTSNDAAVVCQSKLIL